MTLGMQGTWTVSVVAKSALWKQRFRIHGSSNGADRAYDGDTSTPPVFVTGDQWGVTVEHDPAGPAGWTPSRFRLRSFAVGGGQFRFDMGTDDSGGDGDFNDLVLRFAMPLSASDWVVWGRVRTYGGFCLFNPCFPRPWLVIDTPLQLSKLLEYDDARVVLEKLYPERVRPRPIPMPDPPPFRPMMVPTGLSGPGGFAVEGRTVLAEPVKQKRGAPKAETEPEQLALAHRVSMSSQLGALKATDISALSKTVGVLKGCYTEPASEQLLRFLEYDRTDDERAGGVYTGTGAREVLGVTATDEEGWYVFRFSRSLGELVAESADVASGGDPSVAARPDVMVQLLESLPAGVTYETAPYYDIPNVRRIDLCVPEHLAPRPVVCQGGRALQRVGDIMAVPHPGTTFHSDGTVSNVSPSSFGPAVRRAAWFGTLELWGCFLDTEPPVTSYTVELRHNGGAWGFIGPNHVLPKRMPDATWADTQVGPFDRALRINGTLNPAVTVPAYDNVEEDGLWLATMRHLKLRFRTWQFEPGSGLVELRIRGFDNSGGPVPGPVVPGMVPGQLDTAKFLVDNVMSQGEIDYVKLAGGTDPGACALLDLASPGAPLEIRYRVTDAEGFLSSYDISVRRGSDTPVNLSPAIAASYSDVAPYRFHGTPGFVTTTVAPAEGTWLGEHEFCAFSFSLSSLDRLTDGKATPGGRTLWTELIGMQLPHSH